MSVDAKQETISESEATIQVELKSEIKAFTALALDVELAGKSLQAVGELFERGGEKEFGLYFNAVHPTMLNLETIIEQFRDQHFANIEQKFVELERRQLDRERARWEAKKRETVSDSVS